MTEIFHHGPIACSVATPDGEIPNHTIKHLELCGTAAVKATMQAHAHSAASICHLLLRSALTSWTKPADADIVAGCLADFTYGYREGIWHDATSVPADIDHDVEIVGWGERAGKKFWKIRNRCAFCYQGVSGLCCALWLKSDTKCNIDPHASFGLMSDEAHHRTCNVMCSDMPI